jgi:prepilin-type N-terminal cleavage/methylation domain-containing protein
VIARPGVTLIELIVVIAILGVMAGVAALGVRGVRRPHGTDVAAALVAAARDSALRTGRPVAIALPDSARAPRHATALPDGRVIADADLGIDPFTGRASHATR